VLVNSAGHGAPAIAESLGYPLDGDGLGGDGTVPRLRQGVNRGRYYDLVGGEVAKAIARPIYPVPAHSGDLPEHMKKEGGLGVHITLDTSGAARLGPDTEWLEDGATLDYRADDSRRAAFLTAGRRLLPGLRDEDIARGRSAIARNSSGRERRRLPDLAQPRLHPPRRYRIAGAHLVARDCAACRGVTLTQICAPPALGYHRRLREDVHTKELRWQTSARRSYPRTTTR
jgi:hypothetical protein